MKRVLSLLLALTLSLGLLPAPALAAEAPARTAEFSDVKSSDYYYVPVQWAVEHKITAGTSTTEFSPNQPCTRAQIITFLWKAVGSPEPKGLPSFPDVKPDMYYTKAVAWAQENGIVFGTEFNPDRACHRQSAMEFLWRNAGKPKARKASFEDADWESVDWAVEQGITSGTSETTFSPWNTCTRAQIITFLYRALAEDVEWKFLITIFPNTDISYTSADGKKIVDKHSMTDKEIDLLKKAGELFASDLYDISNHVVRPKVDILVVEAPVTFENLAPYRETMYWMNAAGMRKLLPDSVNLDDYDHVTAFTDIEAETMRNATYLGLGGTDFGQGTGYTFVRNQNTDYVLRGYNDKDDTRWPAAVIVHEFLHFAERWSNKRGCPVAVAVHDAQALGYTNENEWKQYHTDFINFDVTAEDGFPAGVPAAVWRQPPHLFR